MENEPGHPASAPAPPGTLDVNVAADSPTSFSAMHAPAAPPALGSGGTAAAGGGVGSVGPPDVPVVHSAASSFVVRGGIMMAAVIALASTVLLFARWYRQEDAGALIVVGMTAEWDGAEVLVSGPNMPRPLTGVLSAKDNMIMRFHVPPGTYEVRASKMVGGRETVERRRTQEALGSYTTWWPFEAPEPMKREAAAKAAAAAAATRPRAAAP